ncbi:MAG: cobalt-precorrin-5B (C(1))-methyltransferase CbiD [Rikenellaceae bacterium]
MVLIFGGTTQGRIAAHVCDSASKSFYYSTKSGEGSCEGVNLLPIYGGMSQEDIINFCRDKGVKLIIDASHPFADMLHRNITQAAHSEDIPTIRFERGAVNIEAKKRCDSLDEAAEFITNEGYQKVLALTGVNSAERLKELALSRELHLRIMNRKESWDIVERCGFPKQRVLLYGEKCDKELFSEFAPEVILLKESGESGGVPQKTELARRLGIDVVVINRPPMPDYSSVVYGEHGLRRAIDRLLPEYFELSTGITTGSCATAATVAALETILSGERCERVVIELPNGEPLEVEVAKVEAEGNRGVATIIKDAGDDPDITHGAHISSQVETLAGSGVEILAGEGVGVVTLNGLGLAIGEVAINKTPREMIKSSVERMLHRAGLECAVRVTISVEGGEQMAKRTFNPRLGIEGGISILGTSGIVYPFSMEAFVESIRRHIEMITAMGERRVVINSGGKSERIVREHLPDLPAQLFVQYGNMIGETLKICHELGIEDVTLAVMIGKAVKLSEGYLDTHSRNGVMNREFIAQLAQQEGCCEESVERIRTIITARELWDVIPQSEYRLFERIKECCLAHCRREYPDGELTLLLVREEDIFFN